jgi:hypothetical protein
MGCWSLGAYPPVPITKAKKIRRLRRDRLNSNHLNGARFAIASCTDDPWFISFNASHSEAVSPQPGSCNRCSTGVNTQYLLHASELGLTKFVKFARRPIISLPFLDSPPVTHYPPGRSRLMRPKTPSRKSLTKALAAWMGSTSSPGRSMPRRRPIASSKSSIRSGTTSSS